MKLEGCALTHEGNVRKNNEDNYYLFGCYKKDTAENRKKEVMTVTGEKTLVAVFDGMGGEEAGETAALVAAESVRPCGIQQVAEQGTKQLLEANQKICDMMRERNVRMGTTAVQLYVENDQAVCMNLGDSRGYLFRDGKLSRMSKDHSEGQRMIDLGMATEETARKSGSWHKLTQNIGIFPEEFVIEPYISPKLSVENGDIFLLCSDGLTDMLMDDEIQNLLIQNQGEDLAELADELLAHAMEKGGKDNVTIVLLRVKSSLLNLGKSTGGKLLVTGIVTVLLIAAVVAGFVGKKSKMTEEMSADSVGTETDYNYEKSVPRVE